MIPPLQCQRNSVYPCKKIDPPLEMLQFCVFCPLSAKVTLVIFFYPPRFSVQIVCLGGRGKNSITWRESKKYILQGDKAKPAYNAGGVVYVYLIKKKVWDKSFWPQTYDQSKIHNREGKDERVRTLRHPTS